MEMVIIISIRVKALDLEAVILLSVVSTQQQ